MKKIIEIKNERLTVGVSKYGAELQYITNAIGKNFLWNGDEKVWGRKAPVLFPICGSLVNDRYSYKGNTYNMKIHGFAWESYFDEEFCGADKTVLSLSSSEETKKIYPFDFKLKVNFELYENTLSVSYEIENRTRGDMYFSVGAHEGYYCPGGIENYVVEFDKGNSIPRFANRNDIVPVMCNGVLELKNSYFRDDLIVIKNPEFKKVTLREKAGLRKVVLEMGNCDNLLIWTVPQSEFLCLEPWNGIQNWIGAKECDIRQKEGIKTLEAGELFKTKHKIIFE